MSAILGLGRVIPVAGKDQWLSRCRPTLGSYWGGTLPFGRPCFQRKEQKFLDSYGFNKFSRRCGVCYGCVLGVWRLGGHLISLMGIQLLELGGSGPARSWAVRGREWECALRLAIYILFTVGAPSAWSHIRTP